MIASLLRRCLVEHDLLGKPVPTFPDHALASRLVEIILALPWAWLTWQALRPVWRLLRGLSAARALIVRTLPAGSTRSLPLDQHLAADGVGEIEPLQGAAIACRFLGGNLIRHRGEPAAGTKTQRECAGPLGERAKAGAL